MSLFQIELASKRLQNVLKIPASPKYKILSLINFFKLILNESEQSIYNSYYKEFIPHLFKLMNQFAKADRSVCFSPEEIDDIQNVFLKVKNVEALEINSHNLEQVENTLNNEKAKTLSYLDGSSELTPGKEYSIDSINIVLIEKNLDENNNSGFEVGMIHRFNLSSSRRSRSETADHVEFSNLIDIDKTKIVEQLNQVTTIAKKACSKQNIKTHYYNFTYFFDIKEYIYTGSSLGLGGVVLAYNSILINELCKHYYKFRNDTVFTAEIDKDGNLVKLDEKSLRLKLRAVFFSHYKKFVIPEDNIKEAKSELKLLNKKYTKRELQLIPIKSFENVFKNLDIIERCELKFKDKIIANYRRYHTAVNWVLSIMALCVIAFFIINYLIPVLDRNPVIPRLENKKFTAYNKYGIKVWESDFNAHDYEGVLLHEDHFIKSNFQIADLDNDNENEILVLNTYLKDYVNRRSIFCYKSDNALLWQYSKPTEEVYYGGNLFDDNYWIQNIKVFDFNKDGKKEIITAGMLDPWFPCRITIYDNKGNEISHYWNAGHLNEIDTHDLDGDGKDEIYLMGLTNDSRYWSAVLVVLDPDFVEGASFNTDPHRDGKPGLEKYYIIFPKTVLTEFCPSHHTNTREIITKGENNLSFAVCDGATIIYFDVKKSFLVYEFDKNMNVTSVGWSSSFISEYNDLVKERKLEPIKDVADYNDSLKNAVLYWDGDKFVNYATMNKHYLAAKDSIERINQKNFSGEKQKNNNVTFSN